VNGVQACREVYQPKTEPRTNITRSKIAQQQEVAPTTEQWQAFWHRIGPLRLSEWRAAYDSKDIDAQVFDGTQWFLRYTVQGIGHTSSGDNGYPVVGKPKAGTLDSKCFAELTAAFDLLFSNPMRQFAKDQYWDMSLAIQATPVMPTRPCSFCLCLQDGSIFADFDTDNAGIISLRRISFDGFGCCEAKGSATSMSSIDSRVLLDALAHGELESIQVEEILRRFFRENKNLIWSDALEEHELLW
jgi:hypothetical protein